jgi:membrane fusion protein (multidrug efflux system)
MITMLVGCGKNTPEVPPRQVVVVMAEQKDFPIYGNYVGVTKASLEVEIRARVDGFVEEELFLEGSMINKGDVLYRIDKRTYQARVDRLKAGMDHDMAALAKAGRDVERVKPLYEQNAASQLDYDNALKWQLMLRVCWGNWRKVFLGALNGRYFMTPPILSRRRLTK